MDEFKIENNLLKDLNEDKNAIMKELLNKEKDIISYNTGVNTYAGVLFGIEQKLEQTSRIQVKKIKKEETMETVNQLVAHYLIKN